MAKVEAEVVDPFLAKESPPLHQPYYNIHAPFKDYEHQPYLVVPLRPVRPRPHISICCMCYHTILILLVTLLFLTAVGLVLWPSQPELKIVNIQLSHVNISKSEGVNAFLDTSMNLKVKIWNRDFISHNYNLILISIGYEGKWLGTTTSNATFVNARSVSYLDATVRLNGTQDLEGSFKQHDDITKGSIPLEIVIEVGERFHFFSINIPIQVSLF
uniref:Putative inorganic polyphosphate/ATP-NAD kinase n=1 Tax=Anthurium amnicola TaxID=1678845 RepID=A0A1D1YYE2_9ARAE